MWMQWWELSLENNKIPTLEEFRVFIEREACGLNELKFVKPDIKRKDEDEQCESIFVNSHIRNADGIHSKLPFRDDSSLGDSKEGALKRFYSPER
ncbi:hypothetical protein TNCV_4684641 [Trichonephila clavipes]|nr:hypothetical protein TNCV_4684641 [Trichonephila clavipes]